MEIEQIKGYLTPIVGELSEDALDKLKETLDEVGVFRFTMALGQSVGNFKPDLGLLLMSRIRSEIGTKAELY